MNPKRSSSECPRPKKETLRLERIASRKPRLDKAERDQMVFQTVHVDALIPEDHPARAIWEFVGKMDLTSLVLKDQRRGEDPREHGARLPKQIVADGGYTNRESILAMADKGVEFIGSMPDVSKTTTAQFARRGIDPVFYPDAFRYNPEQNTYTCPAGKTLSYATKAKRPGLTEHHYRADDNDCSACAFKGKCCPQSPKKGRCVVRTENHPVVSAFVSKMNTPRAKDIYKQRGPTAEFPNAWIKEKMKLRQFRLRGLYKVGMECIWAPA